MMSGAYYNEFDPKAAAWLRELIRRGLIADGEVDDRSILDVRPDDLRGFIQCHFFAGVGGWSRALRIAGWPDDALVWTGSPPCQPFSSAGKQLGRNDPRHLAPHFLDLVRACRPPVLFGEQVASSDVFGGSAKPSRKNAPKPPAWAWLDDLQDRLEAARYAVGASDLPSAGIGAPHIRQRTFFGAIRLADATPQQCDRAGRRGAQGRPEHSDGSTVGGLADADDAGPQGRGQRGVWGAAECAAGPGGLAGGLANAMRAGWSERGAGAGDGQAAGGRSACGTNAPHGFWDAADWLYCRDGKWRPTQRAVLGMVDGIPGVVVPSGPIVPASFPLAQKQERRTMRLRGYGNAINPILACEFILSFGEATDAI